jgi:hypothetical protein
MAKEFNITGTCFPEDHYMADVSATWQDAIELIEKGKYFSINRPRQYGKTTALTVLARHFRQDNDYYVFNMSFEGIGDAIFEEESRFTAGFVSLLAHRIERYAPELSEWLIEQEPTITNFKLLSKLITELANKTPKKLLVIIDEIDKSSNNQLFVSFLALLRDKYLLRKEEKTFHSVVLAGLHDVKTLKLKLRPNEEAKYNSPWNIAAEFKVDMNLKVPEIIPMLTEYVADKGVKMDIPHIAEQLFYYTSGYPFLVSKLCKMLDEGEIKLQNDQEWTAKDIENAVRLLLKEHNTNFDSLIKNLENNPDLYALVKEVAIDNTRPTFNIHEPTMFMAYQHGIIVERQEKAVIHNRIYAEVIANYMAVKVELKEAKNATDVAGGYKNDDNTLNMEMILRGFQIFMKKEYNKKDRDFLEKNGRLVFLAFLKPIINGGGYDFKEPQVSDEKRLDIAVTYLRDKFIVEMKLWRGPKYHEKGLVQLSDYLDTQGLKEGYLIIFDHSEVKNWQAEWIEAHGKKIFVVWV